MVLIHVTRSLHEFIYEANTKQSVDQVTTAIAELFNTILRVKRLVGGVRELAKHGPMKPVNERGLSEDQLNNIGSAEKKVNPEADPLGMRVGKAPDAQLQATLNRCADEAEEAVSNNHAKLRRTLQPERIAECIQNIKGAVMMAYPMGLPEWDSVRENLENSEDLSGCEDIKYILDARSAVLWFAGRAMDRDHTLSKYTSNNEKVTIKAKIEAKNSGAPQREPAVSEEERVKMMALWHKKEQERKKLEEADEDSYLNSQWANPKGFKNNANGIGDIKFKMGR